MPRGFSLPAYLYFASIFVCGFKKDAQFHTHEELLGILPRTSCPTMTAYISYTILYMSVKRDKGLAISLPESYDLGYLPINQ